MEFMHRVVALDTNATIDLFGSPDFSAEVVGTRLRASQLQLVVPSTVIEQVFGHKNSVAAYRRFDNMRALYMRLGWSGFRLGAPVGKIHKSELAKTTEGFTLSREAHDQLFGSTMSKKRFRAWHNGMTADESDATDWHALDREARRLAAERFPSLSDAGKAKNPRGFTTTMDGLMTELRESLREDLWFLESWVRDAAKRRLICRRPSEYRATIALAMGATLNAMGALADPSGHHKYNFLSIQKDNWNDLRILAEVAHCDIFATNDRDLVSRAQVLKEWGYFTPELRKSAHLPALTVL